MLVLHSDGISPARAAFIAPPERPVTQLLHLRFMRRMHRGETLRDYRWSIGQEHVARLSQCSDLPGKHLLIVVVISDRGQFGRVRFQGDCGQADFGFEAVNSSDEKCCASAAEPPCRRKDFAVLAQAPAIRSIAAAIVAPVPRLQRVGIRAIAKIPAMRATRSCAMGYAKSR